MPEIGVGQTFNVIRYRPRFALSQLLGYLFESECLNRMYRGALACS
jgi:hypothetical protein